MKEYIEKPMVVLAEQYNGQEKIDGINLVFHEGCVLRRCPYCEGSKKGGVYFITETSVSLVNKGDWLVKDKYGVEIYDDKAFNEIYELKP